VKYFTALSCNLLCAIVGLAQSDPSFELSYKNGYLAAHRTALLHLPQHGVHGFELAYELEEKKFDPKRKIRKGVSVLYLQGGNREMIGNIYGVFPHGKMTFFSKGRFSLLSRFGLGLGYVEKVFDQEKNPLNMAVSSHLNVLANLNLRINYGMDKFDFFLGSELVHFSNGALKLPNLGLNYMLINTGLNFYIPVEEKKMKVATVDTRLGMRNEFQFLLSGGVKEVYPIGGELYSLAGASLGYRRRLNGINGIDFLADFVYNTSLRDYFPQFSKTNSDLIQVGLFAGHVIQFNRFSTLLGMGVQLIDKYKINSPFYHRLGLRYYLNKSVQAGFAVRSNWGKADFLEWSIIYLLPRK
jgi:hypothetical protein